MRHKGRVRLIHFAELREILHSYDWMLAISFRK